MESNKSFARISNCLIYILWIVLRWLDEAHDYDDDDDDEEEEADYDINDCNDHCEYKMMISDDL